MSKAEEISLTEGQDSALRAILDNKNVFLTGNAGTGKSVVIEQAKRELDKAGRKVLLCAPTGIAAQNIGGTTIHKLFGVDIKDNLYEEEVLLRYYNKKPPKTLTANDVAGIVVDEIGMVRRDLMNAMTAIILNANATRRQNGLSDLQIILVGDFTQLPPVTPKEDRPAIEESFNCKDRKSESKFYAFESGGWAKLGLEAHLLTEQLRQSEDEKLRRNLNLAQQGDIECLEFFNERICRPECYPKDAVYLCGKKRECENTNEAMLDEIHDEAVHLHGEIKGEFPLSEFPAPQDLELKKGARVMCTANGTDDNDVAYSNGSLGYVRDFIYEEGPNEPSLILVELDTGKNAYINKWKFSKEEYRTQPIKKGDDSKTITKLEEVGSYRQFPLKLAWAITHHKSQGQTLDKAVVNPYAWDPGQLYTALSRVKKTDDLYLTERIKPENLIADKNAMDFYRNLRTGEPAPVSASSSGDLRLVEEQIRRDKEKKGEQNLEFRIKRIKRTISKLNQYSVEMQTTLPVIKRIPAKALGSSHSTLLRKSQTALNELNETERRLQTCLDLILANKPEPDSSRSAEDATESEIEKEDLIAAEEELEKTKSLLRQLKQLRQEAVRRLSKR